MLSVRDYQYQTAQFNYHQFFTTELKKKSYSHIYFRFNWIPHTVKKMAHCFNAPYSVLSIFSLMPFSNNKTEFTAILKYFNFLKTFYAHVHMCTMCVQCPRKPEEGVGPPGAEATESSAGAMGVLGAVSWSSA